ASGQKFAAPFYSAPSTRCSRLAGKRRAVMSEPTTINLRIFPTVSKSRTWIRRVAGQQQQRPVRVTMLEICTSTTAIWMQIMTTAPRAARRKALQTSGNSARAQGPFGLILVFHLVAILQCFREAQWAGSQGIFDPSDVQELPSCLSFCRNALQSVEFDQ